MFQKISGIEKCQGYERGEYRDFPPNFFVSVPKTIVTIPSVFR